MQAELNDLEKEKRMVKFRSMVLQFISAFDDKLIHFHKVNKVKEPLDNEEKLPTWVANNNMTNKAALIYKAYAIKPTMPDSGVGYDFIINA